LINSLTSNEQAGAECYDTFTEALAAARNYKQIILVAGSLFLVGEARAVLFDKTFLASVQ
jgi:folylpolyglutamate synthase/dihydropteroate synthase